MQSVWAPRFFFGVVGVIALGAVVSGAACTRYGQPGPITPTLAPLSTIDVDPTTGSDTSGNGSQLRPYKTLTKAVAVLIAAKNLSPGGITISLAPGAYTAQNGEHFPIVIPKSVTITGSNYAGGIKNGSFVNGIGEDAIFEGLVGAPARTSFATLEIVPPANVTLNTLFVGASKISLPGSRAVYSSVDVIGTASASIATLGAGIVSSLRNVNGVLVASGTFTCSSCQIHGNNFGIGALTVPLPSAPPSSSVIPSVTLAHSTGDSTIVAKVVDILTDGSANVTVSGETFARAAYAYEDAITPVMPVTIPGAVDFGGGAANSPGGNLFIGARITEISLTKGSETVSALDDAWNPNVQGANRNGQYPRTKHFGSGTAGKNVTIARGASGSTVTVGPAPVPTPSTTPSGPTPTPT